MLTRRWGNQSNLRPPTIPGLFDPPSSSTGRGWPPTSGCTFRHGEIAGLDLSEDMEVEQFPGGHSNLTYLVRFGDVELVLRRPPFGPVPPSAHDMAREYRWLSAMHPVFPPAPRPHLFCDDPSVVGAMFYVMERRHGSVVRGEEPPGLANRPDVRRHVSERLVDTLAELHGHRRHSRRLVRARQAGRLRPSPGAWMERAVAAIEDCRSPRDGRAGRSGCCSIFRRIASRRQWCTAISNWTTSCWPAGISTASWPCSTGK